MSQPVDAGGLGWRGGSVVAEAKLQQQFFREYFPLFRAAVLKEGVVEK
jgi:hypothetical protein